jgi:phospholipase C
MKRRDAIKTIGALAGAAGVSKLLSACGKGGGGGEAGITTYVFLMMENRSYDHYLGARSLLEGLPGDGLTAEMSNPDLDGNPVGIWPAGDGEMCIIDPPHGWDTSRAQFNDGENDGFVRIHQLRHGSQTAIEPMQYMERARVPIHNALADAYTSCDRWFCSVMGGTMPNRMYWHAGTSNGAQNNDQVVFERYYEGVPTLYHRLETAGIEWAYYYHDLPVLAVLGDEGLDVAPHIHRIQDFLDHAAEGRLPPVVYIDPSFTANDDHPPHHPMLGQQLIAAVYQALATSPQWKNCMLVVTYDEHGGFFDHVPPPSDAVDDRAAEGFNQLGFRVPTVVAGPYVKQGHVTSVVHDHTSALKHLEDVFGLAPLTARVSAATNLVDCLDLERLEAGEPADPIQLPAIDFDLTQQPNWEDCHHPGPSSPRLVHHDIVAWADARPEIFGRWDRRHHARDDLLTIARYLERHGLLRNRL